MSTDELNGAGDGISNPRHSAWEADTLPAELLPLRFTLSYSVCLSAKAILRQSVGCYSARGSRRCPRLVLCGLPTLSLNLKRARTYAERMFRHVVIGHLERGDAWDALGIPLRGTGRSFDTSLVGRCSARDLRRRAEPTELTGRR